MVVLFFVLLFTFEEKSWKSSDEGSVESGVSRFGELCMSLSNGEAELMNGGSPASLAFENIPCIEVKSKDQN
jgi:hypothetical protein